MNRTAVAIGILCLLVGGLARPARATIAVVGGLTRQATLQPGATIEGRIVVRNIGEEPEEVKFYQTDYQFSADGRILYGEPGGVVRSSAPWITIFPQQLTVAPGSTDSISYVLNAPDDPNLTGTYWSTIMVEPVTSERLEPQAQQQGQVGIGIRTVMRHAIQMVTHIGTSGERALAFADRQLVIEGDKRILQIDIPNTGERWLIPLVWAELYDSQGVSIGRFEGGQLRIYPGCSARFRIDLSDVPTGSYRALVVADCGTDDVFGAQYELDIP